MSIIIKLFKSTGYIKWFIIFSIIISITTGCSIFTAQSSKPSSSNSNKNSVLNVSNSVSVKSTSDQESTINTLLGSIMKLAKQGKVINCEFAAKITTIEDVNKKWGNSDKTEWIPTAKGNYATYLKHHNNVFGFNKGSQIFEVRSFDKTINKISLSKVKEVFGTPAYDVKVNGEEIIGYTAGTDFKILFVFPKPLTNSSNNLLDHYSILYPKGTVNMMADDHGREW